MKQKLNLFKLAVKGRSIVPYTVISGLCFLLSNAILIAGDWEGLALTLSICISFILVGITGYVLHSLLSFRQPLSLPAFGRYALAMSFNIPLAFITVWLWRDAAKLPMLYAAPLATACATVVNFLLSRWAISGRPESLN